MTDQRIEEIRSAVNKFCDELTKHTPHGWIYTKSDEEQKPWGWLVVLLQHIDTLGNEIDRKTLDFKLLAEYRDKLTAEVERLKKDFNFAICAYCAQRVEKTAGTLMEHISHCEKRPDSIKKINELVDACKLIKEENESLTATVERCKEALEKIIEGSPALQQREEETGTIEITWEMEIAKEALNRMDNKP